MKTQKVLFKDLFIFQNKSKIKAGYGLNTNEGKYPFYTSSSQLTKSINEYQFENDSLIFGTGGQASIHFQNSKFAVSTDCFVCKPNNGKILTKYVYHYLNGNIHILESGFKGAGLKHISKGYIEDLEIPLPPLATQKAIAEKLDKADALRKKDQELLKQYDELAQSIFIEMFGDPVQNEKGWETNPIIKYSDCIVPGRDKPKSFTGEIPWVTTEDLIHLGETNYSKKNIGLTIDEINEVRAKIIPENSLIMTCVGDLGVISIAKREMIINQQLHSYQLKDNLNIFYVMYDLSYRKNFMNKMASTTTVPYMNKSICNSIPINVPPLELQNQFAEKIKNIEAQKELVKKQAEASENLFQALLQESFNFS